MPPTRRRGRAPDVEHPSGSAAGAAASSGNHQHQQHQEEADGGAGEEKQLQQQGRRVRQRPASPVPPGGTSDDAYPLASNLQQQQPTSSTPPRLAEAESSSSSSAALLAASSTPQNPDGERVLEDDAAVDADDDAAAGLGPGGVRLTALAAHIAAAAGFGKGPSSNSGGGSRGACSLLQVGSFNVMLDCGGFGYAEEADLTAMEDVVRSLTLTGGGGGRGVDFVLLSHGDLPHVGALPLLFGTEGVLCEQGQPPVVVCTLPVFKMAQMALYDLHVNLASEARPEGCRGFTLDDVDHCLKNVVTVKYNQACIMGDPHGNKMGEVTFTAHASGRTIGGSAWVVRHGCAEVVYAMDTNLRKETLLEGAAIDSLPESPSLLIVESPTAASTASAPRRPRGRDREDAGQMVAAVMETVRAEGNVLIPCESAGRTLELLVTLSRHWVENNLGGMYHLVYLSPMASSTIEFARCQLEWISDSLCQGFYLGRANPLALPFVRIASSLRDLDAAGPGPKVVLATDASLNHGFAKALLLRWGGDPKCRVLFVDNSDPHSLASDLRSQDGSAGPVIATVVRSERVKLTGDELEEFLKEREARRRIHEAAAQRRRREREITALATTGDADSAFSETPDAPSNAATASANPGSAPAAQAVGRLTRFAQPRHRVFETRDDHQSYGDYGRSIDGLVFEDFNAIAKKRQQKLRANQVEDQISQEEETIEKGLNDEEQIDSIPTKIIGEKIRVQFTCSFRELQSQCSGRADLRAIRTMITRLSPHRVAVLRGGAGASDHDVDVNLTSLRDLAETVWAPRQYSTRGFTVRPDKFKIVMPLAVTKTSSTSVKSTGRSTEHCTITKLIPGSKLLEIVNPVDDGVRMAKLVVPTSIESLDLPAVEDQSAISYGEVLLDTLKQRLELCGLHVVYRLGKNGGMLICDNSVIIQKSDENDLTVEGSSCRALIEARRVLYDYFAIL